MLLVSISFYREKKVVMSEVYDKHTIVVNIGTLPVEDTNRFIDDIHKSAVKYIRSIDPQFKCCKYYLNTPSDSRGVRSSKTRYWVSDPRVFYIIIGKNPDGSDRVERNLLPSENQSDDWGDDAEYIVTILDPIIPIPPFVDENGIKWKISFERAFGASPSYGSNRYKLVCSRPDRLPIGSNDVDELMNVYRRYSPDPVIGKLINGKLHIDYGSFDASMPLVMTKVFILNDVTYTSWHDIFVPRDRNSKRGSKASSPSSSRSTDSRSRASEGSDGWSSRGKTTRGRGRGK